MLAHLHNILFKIKFNAGLFKPSTVGSKGVHGSANIYISGYWQSNVDNIFDRISESNKLNLSNAICSIYS